MASDTLAEGLFTTAGMACMFRPVMLAQALVRTVARTISRLYVLTSVEHLYYPSWEIPFVLALGILSALAGAWVRARA